MQDNNDNDINNSKERKKNNNKEGGFGRELKDSWKPLPFVDPSPAAHTRFQHSVHVGHANGLILMETNAVYKSFCFLMTSAVKKVLRCEDRTV